VGAHRIYADSQLRDSARTGSLDKPIGLIHMSKPEAPTTLCGLAVDQLHEFGAHFEFDQFPAERRCPGCSSESH